MKVKMLPACVTLLVGFALLAVPAMANFVSTGQGVGPIKTIPETMTFKTVEGGPAIECKSAEFGGGEWHIQGKAAIKQGKYFYHGITNKGPRMQLKVLWGSCKGPNGTNFFTLCNLEIAEVTIHFGLGAFPAPGCELLTAFRFSSHYCAIVASQGSNTELFEVPLANVGKNTIEASSQIKGMTTTIEEAGEECKALKIKGGQRTGSLITKTPFIIEGVQLE
jgi:hypothetical protein